MITGQTERRHKEDVVEVLHDLINLRVVRLICNSPNVLPNHFGRRLQTEGWTWQSIIDKFVDTIDVCLQEEI